MRGHLYLTFIMMTVLSACSSVHYQNSQKIPVYVSGQRHHDKLFEVSETREFFLWGMRPKQEDVFIDQEFEKVGAQEVSLVKIEEGQNFLSRLWTFLSLGMLKPIDYKLSARGIYQPGREVGERQ